SSAGVVSPRSFSTCPTAPVTCTLSLHDALPIWLARLAGARGDGFSRWETALVLWTSIPMSLGALLLAARLARRRVGSVFAGYARSEEHTSELQSLTNLVCRLLLEKKTCRALSLR